MLTITFSDDAYETFVEALKWPTEKEYNAKLTLTDGSEIECQLQRLHANESSGVRFKRSVDVGGITYLAETSEYVGVWHDTEPYLNGVHIY